jgi:DnaJ-class molecular chaperone
MDPYKVLGVDKSATQEDIKNSYRKLASKHHPDKQGGDTTTFQQIQAAYDILSDASKRQAYDNPSPQYRAYSGSSNPFQDMINEFMRQTQQRIYTITIFITIEQSISGAVENVHINTPNGPKLIQLSIPVGIGDGQQVRYEGIIPDGPLQVIFRLHQHPKFERQGNNLYSRYEINVLELLVGTKITVTDVYGTDIEISIPAMTKPDSKFRLPGKGLKSNGTIGDYYVLLVAKLPDKLSPEFVQSIKKEVNSNT